MDTFLTQVHPEELESRWDTGMSVGLVCDFVGCGNLLVLGKLIKTVTQLIESDQICEILVRDTLVWQMMLDMGAYSFVQLPGIQEKLRVYSSPITAEPPAMSDLVQRIVPGTWNDRDSAIVEDSDVQLVFSITAQSTAISCIKESEVRPELLASLIPLQG